MACADLKRDILLEQITQSKLNEVFGKLKAKYEYLHLTEDERIFKHCGMCGTIHDEYDELCLTCQDKNLKKLLRMKLR